MPLTGIANRRRRAVASLALTAALATGCARTSPPATEGERITAAALRLLAADGRPLCVDRRTRGQPLAIFRSMIDAPRPSRDPLAWHAPTPLRPPSDPTAGAIYRDQTGRDALRLRRPVNPREGMPPIEQMRLNTNARALLADGRLETVTIPSGWAIPGVTVRWAPLNWLRASCSPRYVLSNPVYARDFGYQTVSAGRWGTTYAFERVGGAWRPAAQWSVWLY